MHISWTTYQRILIMILKKDVILHLRIYRTIRKGFRSITHLRWDASICNKSMVWARKLFLVYFRPKGIITSDDNKTQRTLKNVAPFFILLQKYCFSITKGPVTTCACPKLLAVTARFFVVAKKEEKSFFSCTMWFGQHVEVFWFPKSHSLKQRKHQVKIKN